MTDSRLKNRETVCRELREYYNFKNNNTDLIHNTIRTRNKLRHWLEIHHSSDKNSTTLTPTHTHTQKPSTTLTHCRVKH